MKKIRSLRTKLVASVTAASAIFFVVLGIASYLLYSNNVIKIANDQIASSNYQSLANYQSFFDDAISVTNSAQKKLDNVDIYANKENLIEYFDDIMSVKSDITSINFYDEQTATSLVHSTKYNLSNEPKKEKWFVNSIENPMINIFSRIEIVENQNYAFSLSKYITYDKSSKGGVLKVDFDFNEMVGLISQSELGVGGHVTIYDKDYNIVFCSETYQSNELDVVKKLVLGTTISKRNNIEYNLFISTIPKTGWKVAIFTNFSEIAHVINVFLLTIILCGLGLTILFILFMIFLSGQITKPIRLLQLEMSRFASLNYDVKNLRQIKGSKEVEDLNNSFNKMLLKIRELANKLVIEENNKRTSELKALQNQINPHFLYNTLDSIVYLIDSDEKEKASEMIIALSKFFRISISKGKNIIPLSKEVEHVSNYLLIQKIRFGKQFEYTIDVDKKLLDYPVIKLILQPIVENSIIHGFNELESVGKIDITGKLENGLIRFDIKDNGYGILPEKIEQIYASFKDDSVQEGVGFKNVYQRLKIYYGEKADIKIISELDFGTDVILFIPYEEDLKYE